MTGTEDTAWPDDPELRAARLSAAVQLLPVALAANDDDLLLEVERLLGVVR